MLTQFKIKVKMWTRDQRLQTEHTPPYHPMSRFCRYCWRECAFFKLATTLLLLILVSGCTSILNTWDRRLARKVTVNTVYEYYPITGKSVDEIRRSMNRNGPLNSSGRHVIGYTQWSVDWQYRRGNWHGLCIVRDFRANVDVQIWLPQWEQPVDVSPELARDWKRFADALEFHENRHRDNAIETGHELVRELYGISSYNCDSLERLVNGRAEAILDRHQEWDGQYDNATNHGLTEGARWPPPEQ